MSHYWQYYITTHIITLLILKNNIIRVIVK